VEILEKLLRTADVYNLNTRRKLNLHMPNTNLIEYQGGIYYTDKLFNNLPPTIKSLNHEINVTSRPVLGPTQPPIQ
jgi:hypothetical protein